MRDPEATVGMQTADLAFDIVLKPVSHPETGDIRIDESLFAIGRTEPPFSDYPPEIVADLSRRHARIFSEHGSVYIADLDSKNGTAVNGIDVQQKITRLQDGDEICFGGRLTYRVRLGKRKENTVRASKLVGVVLNPEREDLGLQPIVITSFPFLISKADDAFARYRDDFPHQVNYLSRRHAHIFLKGGQAFVEDLGSTNGTFVAGRRLDEHAVPLGDGDSLAFGGHHFVYRVSLHKEEREVDPTVTKLSPLAQSVARAAGNPDKTTFVAAPDSFLDIFCVDPAPAADDEVNDDAAGPAHEAGREAGRRKPRGRAAIFLSELAGAFSGGARGDRKRPLKMGAAAAVVLGGAGLALYLNQAPERELRDLLASGDYAKAASIASSRLEQDASNAELKTLGTEALLKAHLPDWMARLKARDFDGAGAILGRMKESARHNDEAQPLLAELEWMGNLARFMAARGGAEAPIRIYGDEERIRALLKHWEDGTQRHQRAFALIAQAVPAFEAAYADALSQVRRLQSDEAVYLAAIERLKITVNDELKRDRPEALEPVFKEYAEKYPRIGGLDALRQDLRLYMEIDNDARARNLGGLMAKLEKAKFQTPPFQERFRTLSTGSLFPPPDIVRQYQAANKAWREGDAAQSFALLEKLQTGPWEKSVAAQLQRRRALVEQFAALQKAQGGKDYDERLLAFYGSLDPDDDIHYIRATEADIGRNRDKAMARAQDLMARALARWRQYRDNGAIEGAQRLEGAVSSQFRSQARLLTEAQQSAQQGMLIARQLKADTPAEWNTLRSEIDAEAAQQRKDLQDLRTVLDPNLLKEKLALIGGRGNGF
ncbi:MAG TPA: FHA domain-containing protein [Noviherbaspirillum sp.]|uniref:FHA domain-containing protein n=1 Tax=Noviherbaspirillum sp. TaxID=1926288 RepID=UPI002D650747|nr:FHA domain-containing protein [Noviherbaspirillum sp.]HYD96148.1 FHA domain-containing protein [Noviherbaspirillum sp.]